MVGYIYQLKVTIKDVKPPVWRRLLLPSDATFWELHIAIQDSLGWQDYHLHEFWVGSPRDENFTRILIPHPDNFILSNEKAPLDESKTTLSDILSEKQPKITYTYDFGDNWDHEILLEKILPFEKKGIYPHH